MLELPVLTNRVIQYTFSWWQSLSEKVIFLESTEISSLKEFIFYVYVSITI